MRIDPVTDTREPRPLAAKANEPSFVLETAMKSVYGEGEAVTFQGTLADPEPWLARIERHLAAHGRELPFVAGALPFDERTPIRLFAPERVSSAERDAPTDVRPSLIVPRASIDVLPHQTRSGPAFMVSVAAALHAIERGELRKVVLARAEDITLPRRIDIRALIDALRAGNPHGFVYALRLDPKSDEPIEPSTLVGASPELLLSRRGDRVTSLPLAGSSPRSTDAREDRERAEALLRSPKDRHEHRLVIEHVLDTLQPFMRELRYQHEPVLTSTPTIWHLATSIEGTLRDTDVSALRLAAALHPTPAVCGLPTREAREWIREVEPVERGYFTGSVGHVDANGDGDWIVAIRCARITGQRARVFAGAGIVEGSVPELEFIETEAKMRTMVGAIRSQSIS